MTFRIRNHRLGAGTGNVHFAESPNVGGALDPKFLVVHYTASGPSFNVARYFAKPEARVSAHLVIPRDGTVVQCVPFNKVGWHAGPSRWTDRNGREHVGLNQSSIGIEIENWGPLRRTGAGWASWTGEPVDPTKVAEARHKFGTPDCGWETFTPAQIETAIAAAQAICSEYGIVEIVGHDDIAPGRKSDPGPAWNMASFRARVFGRNDDGPPTMVVRSATGLNVRAGPGADHVLVRSDPLPDGALVVVLEASSSWRFVSVLNGRGQQDFSGWVHGAYLFET